MGRRVGRRRGLVAAAMVALLWLLVAADPAHAAPPPWSPAGYDLMDTTTFEMPDENACSPGEQWTWSDGENNVGLIHVPCRDQTSASVAAHGQVLLQADHPDERVLGVEHVSWDDAQGMSLRVWVQGDAIVVLATAAANGDQAATFALGAELAPELSASLPGEVVAPAPDGQAIQGTLVLLPLIAWLVLVLPARGVIALLRPRYAATSPDPRWRDVTADVAWVRRRRRVRRVGWTSLVIGSILILVSPANAILGNPVALEAFRAAAGAGLLTLGIVLVRRRRPYPIEQAEAPPSSRGARAWIGATLIALAYALAVVVLLTTATAAVVAVMLPPNQGLPSLGLVFATGSLSVPVLMIWLGVLVRDALLLVLVGVLVVLAVVAGLDTLGRRLRAASLREALARDTRPPVLYLRSFDEDRLSIPATLHRRGLMARLNVVRRRRFEEAIVVQLRRIGPVVAIAPPGTRLPPIGAARASYAHDEWQGAVEDLANRAAVVVLSATPASVREGFGWEIDLVAHRLSHSRVLVIVAPWRSRLASRWGAFRSYVATMPLFAGLVGMALPDGVHLALHTPSWGWAAWGATRRTDWSYAVAIDHALTALTLAGGAPAQPDPSAAPAGGAPLDA